MQYQFCPHCGNKYTENTKTIFHCNECNKTVYANSKPTASVLITKEDNILLGKRGIEPSKGMWDIIGGFLNYGEHPHDGARREAQEETGLAVEIKEYLGSFMDEYGEDKEATLNMGFIACITGGEMQPNDDIIELKWFSIHELPQEIAFENGKRMLELWKESKI